MKLKFRHAALALAAAVTFTACQDELPYDGGAGAKGEDDGSYMFINAAVALPTSGSRSQTDTITSGEAPRDTVNGNLTNSNASPDYEYGHDFESEVRSMILVIATQKDEYVASMVVTGLNFAATSGSPYYFTTSAKIPYATLDSAYKKSNFLFADGTSTQPATKPKVRIYAFCNYTQDLLDKFGGITMGNTEWVDFVGTVEESASQAGQTPQTTSSIWSNRSFLMSNSSIYETELPATIEEWDPYADKDNPYRLTPAGRPIYVERASARIDYRDGSKDKNPDYVYKPGGEESDLDYVYPIYINRGSLHREFNAFNSLSTTSDSLNLFTVALERMVLVNMNKQYHYLRRVSPDGLASGATLCGLENYDNYVVDAFSTAKKGGIAADVAGSYFNFPLFDIDGTYYNNIGFTSEGGARYGWYISDIKDVLNGRGDTWVAENDALQGKYHIWRYVTENTIPGGPENQKVGQSTGIIFKAQILPGNDISETWPNSEASLTDPDSTRYVSTAVEEAFKNVKKLDKNMSSLPVGTPVVALYSFNNMLYGGPSDLVKAAMNGGNGDPLFYAIEELLKDWYLDKDSDDKVFRFCGKYEDVDSTSRKPANNVQLTVQIAHQILNGATPKDGSAGTELDYSTGEYSIDFKDYNPKPKDALDAFVNSRFIELAPSHNITVFIPTNDDGEGWGYYCYYFYWNRHNDNRLSGKMGPMEFATVRNNVYKLAVTNITGLGRPRNPKRDPDPLTPNTPDERPENSIEVEINVLPWVVRVNDIEF